jgi:hypothetical protein
MYGLGGLIGSMGAGTLADKLGRKRASIVASAFVGFGALLMAFAAPHVNLLVVGRSVTVVPFLCIPAHSTICRSIVGIGTCADMTWLFQHLTNCHRMWHSSSRGSKLLERSRPARTERQHRRSKPIRDRHRYLTWANIFSPSRYWRYVEVRLPD